MTLVNHGYLQAHSSTRQRRRWTPKWICGPPCNDVEPFAPRPPRQPHALGSRRSSWISGHVILILGICLPFQLFSGQLQAALLPQSLEFSELMSSASKKWWSLHRKASGHPLGGDTGGSPSIPGGRRQEALAMGLWGLKLFPILSLLLPTDSKRIPLGVMVCGRRL